MARENLVAAQRVLDLINQRLNAGTASSLEVSEQQSVVNTQRASIPPLQQTVTQNRNALAVLMGRSPEFVHVRGGSLRAIAIPRVTPGLPSELLTQRPDIREAEAQLAAANANVANARAQFLPSITLTGEGGYQSAVLKTLLRPELAFYSLAAGLTQPIFHGGQLLGNLDLQKGRQDELLQNYRKAVISAFSDVETALDAIRQTALRERLQRDVVTSSRQAFQISEQRLREGTIDLVTVLQTQQTLFQAEDGLGAGAARTYHGGGQPLSGARRRLAAETGGSLKCTVSCRKSRRRRKAARAAMWRPRWSSSRSPARFITSSANRRRSRIAVTALPPTVRCRCSPPRRPLPTCRSISTRSAR